MNNRLEEALVTLYKDRHDRFYTYLMFNTDRVASDKIPTMGVGVINKRLKLIYNNDFVNGLPSIDHLVTIIKHECLHLAHKHLERANKVGQRKSKSNHMLENIAMDYAINQYLNEQHIEDITGVNEESFRALLKHTNPPIIESKRSYEYYLSLLDQEKEKRKENGDMQEFLDELEKNEMDDHGEGWSLDPLDAAIIEDHLRKSAEKARSDGYGRLPGDLEELFNIDRNYKVSWQRELRQFVGYNTRIDNKKSRSKRNRRYGIKVAGKKKDYKAKILVGLDTSGSMSGDRTDKVLSELYGIYKNLNISLDIVECDTEITSVFSYDGKENFSITGRGGTELSPCLEYAVNHKYDGVIILTDGEFNDEGFDKYNIDSLWVIADNNTFTSNVGRTIHLD